MKYFFNPFKIHVPVVGIDISGPVVRAVELRAKGGKFTLMAVSEVESKLALGDDPLSNPKDTAKLVSEALESPLFGKFTAKAAVVSLPEYRCFVRVIHVPAGLSDDEVEASIPMEAESYIPLGLDQVYLDWQRIKSSDEREAILLAAAPKDLVEGVENLIQEAGLIPAGLEVESMSLARAVLGGKLSRDILLVDIGTNRTDLVVVEQGSVQFASSIPLAEESFVSAAVSGLGLTKPSAVAFLKETGVKNTAEHPNVRQVFSPQIQSLSAEIRNILNFHSGHSPRRLEAVELVGKGAGFLGLQDELSAELPGVVVEYGDPWKAVGVSAPGDLSGLSGGRFCAALGLALRSVVG